ncbi:hypothetical protein SS50377_21739 [Spironucleus salmonicida]|uniref:Uncharacterized protein n=1 Tax=Spironucleus salmonicida TaxID=348837 RepID=A0A9P8LX28_9EUKA|nr:hypothetical protein SS50377_21739 [Spironucleus salmonicida]
MIFSVALSIRYSQGIQIVRLVYRFYLQSVERLQKVKMLGIVILQQQVPCLVIILTPYTITTLAYENKLLTLEIIFLFYQQATTCWQIVRMIIIQGLRCISSYIYRPKQYYLIITLIIKFNLEVMTILNQQIQRRSIT